MPSSPGYQEECCMFDCGKYNDRTDNCCDDCLDRLEMILDEED